MQPSRAVVKYVNGRSTLTSSHSIGPLKILNPGSGGDYCSLYLSSYGGGFVQGDVIALELRCLPESRLFLSSQAQGKVYRCPDGSQPRQRLLGSVGTGAVAVVLPDPLVLQKDSLFQQEQIWELENNGMLLLLDWVVAGRIRNREAFAYTRFASKIQINRDGRPLLIDNFRSMPPDQDPRAAGKFGEYTNMFNLYLAGDPDHRGLAMLSDKLNQYIVAEGTRNESRRTHSKSQEDPLNGKASSGRSQNAADKSRSPLPLLSCGRSKPGLFVARGLGSSTEDFLPLLNQLGEWLSAPELLGGNPLGRKR